MASLHEVRASSLGGDFHCTDHPASAATTKRVWNSIRIGATCADYATGSTEDDDAVGADDTDGAAGSYASDTVSSVVNNLAAGSSTATMFRVIID